MEYVKTQSVVSFIIKHANKLTMNTYYGTKIFTIKQNILTYNAFAIQYIL